MEQNTNPQPPVFNQPQQPAQPQPQYQQPYYGLPQMKPQMGFMEAVKTVFIEKYCCFKGRARRSEFWWWQLAKTIVSSIISGIASVIYFSGHTMMDYLNDPMSMLLSPGYIVAFVVSLALLLPDLGVQVRRLHDTGRSGWWLLSILLGIIPIVGTIAMLVFFIILIVWWCKDSDPQPNQYGPSPKYN